MPSSTVTLVETPTFEASVDWGRTGLEDTLGVRLVKDGATIVARTTAGVTEYPEDSGVYTIQGLESPSSAASGVYTVVWDNGTYYSIASLTFDVVEDISFELFDVSSPDLDAFTVSPSLALLDADAALAVFASAAALASYSTSAALGTSVSVGAYGYGAYGALLYGTGAGNVVNTGTFVTSPSLLTYDEPEPVL